MIKIYLKNTTDTNDNFKQIKDELIGQGYEILSLSINSDYNDILRTIDECHILFIINQDGYFSKEVIQEIDYAIKNNKRVVTLNDYLLQNKQI